MSRDGSLHEYKMLYDTMLPLGSWKGRIDSAVRRVSAGRNHYQEVAHALNCPWWLVGIVHELEASCNWEKGLHSGESWRRVTKLEERGRGPFSSWEEAAIDALRAVKTTRPDLWDGIEGWSIAEGLRWFERFNGAGYLKRGKYSPYDWSGSQHGIGTGKYVGDGVYDPEAISHQAGAALLLRGLLEIHQPVAASESDAFCAAKVADGTCPMPGERSERWDKSETQLRKRLLIIIPRLRENYLSCVKGGCISREAECIGAAVAALEEITRER